MTLWSCLAAAYLAQWMVPVAAQWHLLGEPRGDRFVPLVQVALTLPLALLALPIGVLADRVDRRRLVLTVQLLVLGVELALVALAVGEALSPWLLLGLITLLSCGIGGTFVPLSSMVPDLVAKEAIPAASALLTIASNATRVIGPAAAGAILAASSVGVAFAATIPPTVFLLLVMLRLRGTRSLEPADEGWLVAARTGLRFVRHSPQALKLLLRTTWFTTGTMVLFSLLPLLAARFGAASAQLGLLLAMQGVGAVMGALTLSLLARRANPNRVVAIGFAIAGLGLLLAAVSNGLVVLGISVVCVGWAWTTVLATNQAEMQLYLPAWVRTRGLAILLVGIFTGQALGASVAGWLVGMTSTRWPLVAAAALLLAGVFLAVTSPLKDLHHLDRSAIRGWPGPELIVPTSEPMRRLQVRTRYDVPPHHRGRFLAEMAALRRIRLRTGAYRWQLLEDSQREGCFYEEYVTASWNAHSRQVETRLIASDLEVEERVRSLSLSAPATHYALRTEVGNDRT